MSDIEQANEIAVSAASVVSAPETSGRFGLFILDSSGLGIQR